MKYLTIKELLETKEFSNIKKNYNREIFTKEEIELCYNFLKDSKVYIEYEPVKEKD